MRGQSFLGVNIFLEVNTFVGSTLLVIKFRGKIRGQKALNKGLKLGREIIRTN